MTTPKAGEVWTNKNGDTILILAVNGKMITFTQLFYEGTNHTDIYVKGVYANSSMLFSTYADSACEFRSVMTDEEFAEVQKAFAKSLGLAGPSVTLDSSAKDKMIADLSEKCKRLTEELKSRTDQVEELHTSVAVQKRELDVLNAVIDRLIERLAG